MSIDAVPIFVFFVITVAVVALATEVGYRMGGAAHRRSEDEKESPVSAISGAILAMLAFVMAFTFAIVSDRYDARKALVRDEANAIRTAYTRSDFLPAEDHGTAIALLKNYVDLRLEAAQAGDVEAVTAAAYKSVEIQRELWQMAVKNARKDMNSDVAALYIEALNEMTNVHALRISVGLQARLPAAIWAALYALIVLAMLGVGYQTAIAGSRRSWAAVILALSFSMVITLIALLDRPQSSYLAVSQQPMANLQAWIVADEGAP